MIPSTNPPRIEGWNIKVIPERFGVTVTAEAYGSKQRSQHQIDKGLSRLEQVTVCTFSLSGLMDLKPAMLALADAIESSHCKVECAQREFKAWEEEQNLKGNAQP